MTCSISDLALIKSFFVLPKEMNIEEIFEAFMFLASFITPLDIPPIAGFKEARK